jgi:hypothetical protein
MFLCGEIETTKHMFIECQNEEICEIRDRFYSGVRKVLKNRLRPGLPVFPTLFIKSNRKIYL